MVHIAHLTEVPLGLTEIIHLQLTTHIHKGLDPPHLLLVVFLMSLPLISLQFPL